MFQCATGEVEEGTEGEVPACRERGQVLGEGVGYAGILRRALKGTIIAVRYVLL